MSYELNEWDAAQDQTTMTAHLQVIPDTLPDFTYGVTAWPEELTSDRQGMSLKFATLEPSRTRCNGTYKWPSNPAYDYDDEEFLGQWGDALNTPMQTIVLASEADIDGVTVVFDDRGQEWATQFTLNFYGSNDGLVWSTTIEDNTQPYYTVFQVVHGVAKIELVIEEWSVTDATLYKVAEFVPYADFVWSGADILSYEKTMEINPFESAKSIPEARLVVADPSHHFVPLSTESIADSLRQGIPIRCVWQTPTASKLASEWLLYDWSADSDNDEATFIMRPPLGFGRQMTQITTTTSDVMTIAQGLLDRVGMTLWSFEPDMMAYACYTYFGENLNVETAVQQLANSVGAIVDFLDDSSGVAFRYYADAWAEERFIDGGQLWEDPSIVQEKPYKEIVTIYSALQDGSIVEKTHTRTINSKGQGTFTIYAQNASTASQAASVSLLARAYLAQNILITCQLRGDPDMRPWQKVSMAVEGTSIVGTIEKVKTTYNEGILTTECEVRTDGSGE